MIWRCGSILIGVVGLVSRVANIRRCSIWDDTLARVRFDSVENTVARKCTFKEDGYFPRSRLNHSLGGSG
jgi:hypothetical protein